RPKTVHGEAAYHLRPAEEAVEKRHLFAAPSGHVAAADARHADDVGGDLVVVAHVAGGPEEFHVAAYAGEVLPDLGVDAARRVLPVVARIVGERAAHGRDPGRTAGRCLFDRQRGLAVGVTSRRR